MLSPTAAASKASSLTGNSPQVDSEEQTVGSAQQRLALANNALDNEADNPSTPQKQKKLQRTSKQLQEHNA
jgi:hypothetical protein